MNKNISLRFILLPLGIISIIFFNTSQVKAQKNNFLSEESQLQQITMGNIVLTDKSINIETPELLIALSSGGNFTSSDYSYVRNTIEENIDWMVGFIFRNTHPAGCSPRFGSARIDRYSNNMSAINLEFVILWTGCFFSRSEQSTYYFNFTKRNGTSLRATTTGINPPNYRGIPEIELNMDRLLGIGPNYY